MNKIAYLALPLIAGLCVSCSTVRPPSDGGAKTIFNGKDLSNWTAVLAKPGVSKEEVFSVSQGVIACKGEPLGFISTDETFTNFRLSLDYRWAPGKPPGNSGVFLRINGPPTPLPRCIECQLQNGNAGDLYGFHGLVINGPADRWKEVKNHSLGGDLTGVKRWASGLERPAGEWNRVEILANGPTISVWLNGTKVNEATDCEVVAGAIGLQSEGGEIEFRDLRLVPREP